MCSCCGHNSFILILLDVGFTQCRPWISQDVENFRQCVVNRVQYLVMGLINLNAEPINRVELAILQNSSVYNLFNAT